jgi:protein-L-isoaspartate(D-aspartate) O-methyltransferase
MIAELKRVKSLTSPQVESAFQAVPRHLFLPGFPLDEIYSDRAIMTKQIDGVWVSSSSQPSIMAIMLEQLGLEPGQKVLEIGAGTGYNAALMAHLVGETGKVISVDIDEDIIEAARRNLVSAGLERVQVVCADGGYGYSEIAPYDRIILTVGTGDIPPPLWDQLSPGGRLVLPLEISAGQKSIAFERKGDHLASLSIVDCGFMMLQGAFAASQGRRVQIGAEPGLFLDIRSKVHPDGVAVYTWLTSPWEDRETGVKIKLREFFRGLRLWLALQEPGSCELVATGERADAGLVPPLVAFGGGCRSSSTVVLLGARGMAALMRPPEEPVTLLDMNNLFESDSPFPLVVRQFGEDEIPARRLLHAVQSWEIAGRPNSDGLQVRVYPKEVGYSAKEGEFIVEKEWMWLVLEWR